MTKKAEVETDEDCPVCGSRLYVTTKALQFPDRWSAYDGDYVHCKECGFNGWVSSDEGEAGINWDETSAHNAKCAKQYERKVKS